MNFRLSSAPRSHKISIHLQETLQAAVLNSLRGQVTLTRTYEVLIKDLRDENKVSIRRAPRTHQDVANPSTNNHRFRLARGHPF